MRLATWLIVLSLAAPAAAWSQQRQTDPSARSTNQQKQPPRKWWHDERYRSALALSPDQVARIDGIYEQHAVVQRELWVSLQRVEREVSKLIAVEAPNEAKVIAAIERAELLRYKLNERRALLLFKIRQQLTLDQHLKLEKLSESSREERSRSRLPLGG